MQLIFEKSRKGRTAIKLPDLDVSLSDFSEELLREKNNLPELSEVDVVRHFTGLARKNFGVDNGFYPLGSCTMKYNPKINEDCARLDGFANAHPYQDSQGALQLMYELNDHLCEITGMDKFTLQPAAGAHGELTGLMIIKKYFEDKAEKRTKIITPDSSHGTNPASASIAGFNTIQINSKNGLVDLEELKKVLDMEVAAIMLTNPNTLGLFETDILEITRLMHNNGSLVYCDGANMNALMGVARPGDMGFDVLHLNLHKTFSTPHGCGGPGSGPVGVKKELTDFLPNPSIEKQGNRFVFANNRKSIGKIHSFYGNFGVMVKAYTYILAIGKEHIRDVGENAVLNANYLKEKLKHYYNLPYNQICKHEFVLDDSVMPNHVTTMDIAKRLIDYGYHPPTIYFPLIVHGAIMIEPTETESKETMDSFIDTMIKIKQEAMETPDLVKNAPYTTPVSRLDNVKAAREPDIRWKRND